MISNFIDIIIHIDQNLILLIQNYGTWIYVILFLIIFGETGLVITPFLPGDSLIFAAASIAAIGNLNIYLLWILLVSAAIVGDAFNFFIGKYFGSVLFSHPNSKVFKQKYLQQTVVFYQKHGGKTIIIARFLPIIRTFAPFVAGMGHMNYSKFLFYNIFGSILWITLFSLLGFFFGNTELVKNHLSLILIAIIIISLLPILFTFFQAKNE